ncbi:MAG: hypothetical protein K0Q66_2120 [Chitinophagaceae bacterium]|jgi:hypothetical protein|nr:hypothetical protein [Chitinophagaceae bacterium]
MYHKILLIFCITVGLTASAFVFLAREKYNAKVITALGDYEGEVKLDLFGSNKGEISVTTSNSKKSKSGIKMNAKLVKNIIIDSTNYYMEDLCDEGYDIKERYLVTKLYGTDTMGIYSFMGKNGVAYYVNHPNYNYFRNLNHDRFIGTNGHFAVADYFLRCKELYERIESNAENRYTTINLTLEEKLELWKKLIDEYYACKVRR